MTYNAHVYPHIHTYMYFTYICIYVFLTEQRHGHMQVAGEKNFTNLAQASY